jgi:heptosyltransferase I
VPSSETPSLADLRSVLVLKPSSLGDVVHTLPAVHLLKRAKPDLRIAWLANTEWMPLLEGNADLDRVLEFPRRRFRGLGGIGRFLGWARATDWGAPDLVLDFQGLARSAICGRMSGAQAMHCLGNAEMLPRLLSQRVVAMDPVEHAVERYVRLVADLGAPVERPLEFPLPVGTCPDGFEMEKPYVLLHPFSRGEGKSMPTASVERLCALLAPTAVVVAGRGGDGLELPANGTNLLGRTSLAELVWLIRHAAFTVSVDSGPMHIASALTDRLLGIHTWSDPRRVGPYNRNAWIWKSGCIVPVHALTAGLAEGNASFGVEDLPAVEAFLRARLS